MEGWVGWEGTNPDFTLDLGMETSISAISTDFLHQLGAWVLLPKEVRYEVSTDGKAFQPFGEPLVMKEDRDIAVKFVEGKVSVAQPVYARFIRVRIKATGMCPDWHYCLVLHRRSAGGINANEYLNKNQTGLQAFGHLGVTRLASPFG